MDTTAPPRARHLRVVAAGADPGRAGDERLAEKLCAAGFDAAVPDAPSAERRWTACERPGARLRFGACLCARPCAECIEALRQTVGLHGRSNLAVVIVTERDRIVTTARELLARLDVGCSYAAFVWLEGDHVREVYVGRGSTPATASEAHLAWRARARRDGAIREQAGRHARNDRGNCAVAPPSTINVCPVM